MTIPANDPQAAHTTATPGTNGALTSDTDGASLVDSSTVQAGSSTTDAAGAPVPYDPAQPPASPPPDDPNALLSSGDAPEEEEEGMTMLEHLEELRNRIVICAVALMVGLVVSAIPIPYVTVDPDGNLVSVTQMVMTLVAAPAKCCLQYLKPGEGFVTYFQVALMMGFVLALPVLTYQGIAFVLPALLPHEKKYLYMALPGAMISFAIGLFFGYVLVLPVAIDFLLKWNPIEITVMWQFSEYMSTVTTLLLYMGLAFETPLLMFFMTKLRILDPVRVARFRKYMLILSFIIGAMITPTPDPMNQTLVSLPIYLLFELGLLLSRLA